MRLLMVMLIAISLSMDAFSLSLAYGTLNLEKKYINLLSIIVGVYHFFMPIIGMWFGSGILSFIKINPNVIVFIVLLIIGIEMIIQSFKNERKVEIMNFFELLMFGFAVSLDSFSVGIGLNSIYDKPLISAIIFSLFAGTFTYLGLIFGKKLSKIFGKISTLIGGSILIIIGLLYL